MFLMFGRKPRIPREIRLSDIARPLALINDLYDAGEGDLGEVLRPMYVDYLQEHEDA